LPWGAAFAGHRMGQHESVAIFIRGKNTDPAGN
jgi:hypothetical protein